MPDTFPEDTICRAAGFRILRRPAGKIAVWRSPEGDPVPHPLAVQLALVLLRRQRLEAEGVRK